MLFILDFMINIELHYMEVLYDSVILNGCRTFQKLQFISVWSATSVTTLKQCIKNKRLDLTFNFIVEI